MRLLKHTPVKGVLAALNLQMESVVSHSLKRRDASGAFCAPRRYAPAEAPFCERSSGSTESAYGECSAHSLKRRDALGHILLARRLRA